MSHRKSPRVRLNADNETVTCSGWRKRHALPILAEHRSHDVPKLEVPGKYTTQEDADATNEYNSHWHQSVLANIATLQTQYSALGDDDSITVNAMDTRKWRDILCAATLAIYSRLKTLNEFENETALEIVQLRSRLKQVQAIEKEVMVCIDQTFPWKRNPQPPTTQQRFVIVREESKERRFLQQLMENICRS